MAGIAGALYVPQVGIINPGEFAPGNSIEVVIWVAVGGRGTLIGPIIGALLVNAGKSWFTGALPELWLFALGGLFVFVTLFLPKGIVGAVRDGWNRSRASARQSRSRSRRSKAAGGRMNSSAYRRPQGRNPPLSRRRLRLLRRLSRHQQSVAGPRPGRDARDHRPQRRRQDDDDGHHHRQDAARQRRGLLRRARSISPSTTRPRSPCSASAASSRSRPCSRAIRWRTISLLALTGARGVFPTLFHRRSAAHERPHPTRSSTSSGLPTQRARLRGEPLPRPEAVAGDRHAAGAGPEAAAGRRAGRRHDRRRDRGDGAPAAGRSRKTIPSSWSSTT